MVNFRNILINAGRYEDVLEVITNLLSTIDPRTNYPTERSLHSKRTNGCHILNGLDLVREVITNVNVNGKYEPHPADENAITAAICYVSSTLEIDMHNYAVHASHRQPQPEESIDNIRIWLVLQSLLESMLEQIGNTANNDIIEFYVPEGWKRERFNARDVVNRIKIMDLHELAPFTIMIDVDSTIVDYRKLIRSICPTYTEDEYIQIIHSFDS